MPAETCHLSPVDRLFTRLGASDHIMAGMYAVQVFGVLSSAAAAASTAAAASASAGDWSCLSHF